MTFATWNLLFTGMVSSILLLNVVQWGIYRERIYGLYTLYMLAWLVYFSLRIDEINNHVSANIWYFVRATAPILAYFVYFDFADTLIKLQSRLPGLFRLFRVAKGIILAYLILMGVLCFGIADRHDTLYDTAHTVMRLLMVGLATYGIIKIRQLNGVVPRYVALGSAYILVGGIASMVLSMTNHSIGKPQPFLTAPLTYLEFGILAELICFTLVLGYRQRRGLSRVLLLSSDSPESANATSANRLKLNWLPKNYNNRCRPCK
ncbi:7TM diverse intracellular signaling domain-containing protein [Spirosoma telluris]|uniref:7TM diverse intracellular signaling domain-containing protein n=1 Tax=Spirosoma telluris TaxID=2183553 RepID=UPI002FC39632